MYNCNGMIRHGLIGQSQLRREIFKSPAHSSFLTIQKRFYSSRNGHYDARLVKNKPNRKKINASILSRKTKSSHSSQVEKRKNNHPANGKPKYQKRDVQANSSLIEASKRQVRYDTLKVIISSRQQNRLPPKVISSNSKSVLDEKITVPKAQKSRKQLSSNNKLQKPKDSRPHPSKQHAQIDKNHKYETLQKYVTKVCENAILEEKSNTEAPKILTSQDFRLIWFEEPGKQTRAYSLEVLMTPEFLDRFLTKKLQNVGTIPICVDQTMMLMVDDKTAWYGTVVHTQIENLKRVDYRNYSASKIPHTLKIDIQLFDFNLKPLPVGVDVTRIQILPASLATSRLFKALSEIKRSNFHDIILGRKLVPSVNGVIPGTAIDQNSSIVQSIMDNPVTIVSRAQNTDRTKANCDIIKDLYGNGMRPLIVISASNKSLDSMCEKLLPEYKNSLLRIISAAREKFYHRYHKVNSICLHNIVYDKVPTRIKSYLRRMSSPYASLTGNQYKDVKNASIPHSDRIIAERDIIFTTPVCADGVYFKNYTRKPIIVMDEVSQSSEATTLIPFLLRGFSRFVLIGDPQDLSNFSQVPEMSFSHFQSVLNGK